MAGTSRFKGFHHVQLAIPVGGEESSRKFWVNAVGLTEVAKPPVLAARGGCWFRGDQLEIHLGAEHDFVAARKAHPGIWVVGLKALAQQLESAHVSVTWDGELPGFRRFYVDDPFGNRLEFLEPETD